MIWPIKFKNKHQKLKSTLLNNDKLLNLSQHNAHATFYRAIKCVYHSRKIFWFHTHRSKNNIKWFGRLFVSNFKTFKHCTQSNLKTTVTNYNQFYSYILESHFWFHNITFISLFSVLLNAYIIHSKYGGSTHIAHKTIIKWFGRSNLKTNIKNWNQLY